MVMINEEAVMRRKLREAGFDKSSYNPVTKEWTVACSCCRAIVIQDVPCHELGCKNFEKARDGKFKTKY